MKPTIKLMPDYDCWPLWWVSDVGNIDPHTLPLSSEIVERIIRWSDIFDSILNRDDPASSVWSSEQVYETFKREGYNIWRILRDELDDQYIVLYYDRGKLFGDPGEYEQYILDQGL